MEKFIALLQVFIAAVLALLALATLVNLVFISTRPETISVVNTLIGQGLLIVCMAALCNILFRKGWKQLRSGDKENNSAQ